MKCIHEEPLGKPKLRKSLKYNWAESVKDMKDIKDSKVWGTVWGGGYASFAINICHQSSIFVEIDIPTLTHHFSKSVVYIRDQWLCYILHGFRQMCNDMYLPFYHLGFPGSSDDKEFTCSAGDPGSILGSRRSHRWEWQTTPVFLPGESYGQRSSVDLVHGVAKGQTWLSD